MGKTAIIHSFMNEGIVNGQEIKPTTGVANQFKTVNVPGGGKNDLPEKIKLDIWDTTGDE